MINIFTPNRIISFLLLILFAFAYLFSNGILVSLLGYESVTGPGMSTTMLPSSPILFWVLVLGSFVGFIAIMRFSLGKKESAVVKNLVYLMILCAHVATVAIAYVLASLPI